MGDIKFQMECGDKKNLRGSVFASVLEETIEGKAFILKSQNAGKTMENYLALKRPCLGICQQSY